MILAPEGFELKRKKLVAEKKDNDRWVTMTDQDHYNPTERTPILDYSLPADIEFKFELNYQILPDSSEKALFDGFFWILLSVSLVLFGLSTNLLGQALSNAYPKDAAQIATLMKQLEGYVPTLAAGVIAFIGAVIAIVTNPLTHRTKFWLLVPLAVSFLAAAMEVLGNA